MKLAIREGGDDAVHEAEELDPAAALRMRRDERLSLSLSNAQQS
jgi:hypothetical protein